MGCAASNRVENADKIAYQIGKKAENEICDPSAVCSRRQDVIPPVLPVAKVENGKKLNTEITINEQVVLNSPTNLTDLDKTPNIIQEKDDICQGLTNMDVNRETVINGNEDKNKILILHFNDVYNIEAREKEPVGGAARFASKIATFKSRNPLTLFSGDALNPSMSMLSGLNFNFLSFIKSPEMSL